MVPVFFQEGVDGDAESIPPSGRMACAPAARAGEGTDALVSAEPELAGSARTTLPPTSLDDGWPGDELDEEEVEDPARTRRRRAARIGTAWGTVVVLVAAGVAIVLSPRRDPGSIASPASAPPVATARALLPLVAPTVAITSAPVAAPIAAAPALGSAGVASCRSGMVPLVGAAGQASCIDVAESVLCKRDRRTHALRPAGCIDAKTPKVACASRGGRLATAAERPSLAAAKGKTSASAFRCAAPR